MGKLFSPKVTLMNTDDCRKRKALQSTRKTDFLHNKTKMLKPNGLNPVFFENQQLEFPRVCRAAWASSAWCLSEPPASRLRSSWDSSCRRRRGSLCLPSPGNSKSSTSETEVSNRSISLSPTGARSAFQRPCRPPPSVDHLRFDLIFIWRWRTVGPEKAELKT